MMSKKNKDTASRHPRNSSVPKSTQNKSESSEILTLNPLEYFGLCGPGTLAIVIRVTEEGQAYFRMDPLFRKDVPDILSSIMAEVRNKLDNMPQLPPS